MNKFFEELLHENVKIRFFTKNYSYNEKSEKKSDFFKKLKKFS